MASLAHGKGPSHNSAQSKGVRQEYVNLMAILVLTCVVKGIMPGRSPGCYYNLMYGQFGSLMKVPNTFWSRSTSCYTNARRVPTGCTKVKNPYPQDSRVFSNTRGLLEYFPYVQAINESRSDHEFFPGG